MGSTSDDNSQKMKRANNFSKQEEHILVQLVTKYQNFVECKATDTDSNKRRAEGWRAIEKEFNALSGQVYRDWKTLKNKFENMKKRIKKKAADDKVFTKGTGGGPFKENSLSSIENEVLSILGVRAEGHAAEFGTDAAFTITSKTFNENIQDPCEVLVERSTVCNDSPSTSIASVAADHFNSSLQATDPCMSTAHKEETQTTQNGSWASYSPQHLRQPKSLALKRKRKPTGNTDISNKLGAWAIAKSSLEEGKSKYFEEEHTLKMKHMEELHEAHLKEINRRIDREEGKHQLEMEILRKKLQ